MASTSLNTAAAQDAKRFWCALATIRRENPEAQADGAEALALLLRSPSPAVADRARRSLAAMGLLPAICLAE